MKLVTVYTLASENGVGQRGFVVWCDLETQSPDGSRTTGSATVFQASLN